MIGRADEENSESGSCISHATARIPDRPPRSLFEVPRQRATIGGADPPEPARGRKCRFERVGLGGCHVHQIIGTRVRLFRKAVRTGCRASSAGPAAWADLGFELGKAWQVLRRLGQRQFQRCFAAGKHPVERIVVCDGKGIVLVVVAAAQASVSPSSRDRPYRSDRQ